MEGKNINNKAKLAIVLSQSSSEPFKVMITLKDVTAKSNFLFIFVTCACISSVVLHK